MKFNDFKILHSRISQAPHSPVPEGFIDIEFFIKVASKIIEFQSINDFCKATILDVSQLNKIIDNALGNHLVSRLGQIYTEFQKNNYCIKYQKLSKVQSIYVWDNWIDLMCESGLVGNEDLIHLSHLGHILETKKVGRLTSLLLEDETIEPTARGEPGLLTEMVKNHYILLKIIEMATK